MNKPGLMERFDRILDGRFTRAEIAAALGCSDKHALRLIREKERAGRLRQLGSGLEAPYQVIREQD